MENGTIDAKQLALGIAEFLDEQQAEDIVILDVSGPLAIADYFVIATARNQRHAQSLGRELLPFGKAAGATRRGASGIDKESGWVLVDLDWVVVHVFDADSRAFYRLEELWGDVPRVEFTPAERPVEARRSVDGLSPDLPPGWPSGWSQDIGEF